MIEIKFDRVQIDLLSKNAGLFIGRNLITNWDAHSKFNRNVIYNTPGLKGNIVSGSINVIEDNDHLDFLGSSNGKEKLLRVNK